MWTSFMAHIFAKSVMTRSTLRVLSNTVQQQKMRSFRDNRGKATVRRLFAINDYEQLTKDQE